MYCPSYPRWYCLSAGYQLTAISSFENRKFQSNKPLVAGPLIFHVNVILVLLTYLILDRSEALFIY